MARGWVPGSFPRHLVWAKQKDFWGSNAICVSRLENVRITTVMLNHIVQEYQFFSATPFLSSNATKHYHARHKRQSG